MVLCFPQAPGRSSKEIITKMHKTRWVQVSKQQCALHSLRENTLCVCVSRWRCEVCDCVILCASFHAFISALMICLHVYFQEVVQIHVRINCIYWSKNPAKHRKIEPCVKQEPQRITDNAHMEHSVPRRVVTLHPCAYVSDSICCRQFP